MRSHQIIGIVLMIVITFQINVYAQEDCGRRLVKHNTLIADGVESKEGDWPWHAAIYHIQKLVPHYKCGGNIINSNSILTAGHCVFENNRLVVAERIFVHLGKHNLYIHGDNTQEIQVHRVILHPNFDAVDLSNDIAIIRLATEATFNTYVQPICLRNPNELTINKKLEGTFGTAVGWGITETGELPTILRQAELPVVSFFRCLKSNRDFFGSYLSEDNFCAGFRNGTSVCNGDSGGALAFMDHGIYTIGGIVSLGLASEENSELCNSKEFVIFTDVAKHLTWIEKEVPELKRLRSNVDRTRLKTFRGKENVFVNSAKTNVVECNFTQRHFGYSARRFYTCEVFEQSIDELGYLFSNSKNENMIEGINFNYNKNARYLPVNISQVFPNMVEISALFCKIKKVTKENFNGLRKVKAINLSKNELEVIDDDTFSDLISLEWLGLDTNLIRIIDGNVVRGLSALQHLYLAQNICIDKDFHTSDRIVYELDSQCGRANTKYSESANELEESRHDLKVCEAERNDFRHILINNYGYRFQ